MSHLFKGKLDNASERDDWLEMLRHQQRWIDVRAPEEFDKGHVPGAINCPILNDDERAEVGTCYKRKGQNAAVELGDQLVSGDLRQQRIDAWTKHIDEHPDTLLYCFRGGMRSKISQHWLAQQGIHIDIIKGGHKALRQACIDLFEAQAKHTQWFVLGGYTGSGKTTWLTQQSNHIDLEGLAHHKGSAFGGSIDDQPTQINFEFAMARALLNIDDTAPVIVEDEGRFIGGLHFPIVLSDQFSRSPIIVLDRSLEERTEITIKEYIQAPIQQWLLDHPNASLEDAAHANQTTLKIALDKIHKRLGGLRHKQLSQALEDGVAKLIKSEQYDDYQAFISPLLNDYYDPMYAHNLKQKQQHIVFTGRIDEVEAYWLSCRQ